MRGNWANAFRHLPRCGKWLPDMDLNHDKQIQSLLCYRYTIGQTSAVKVGFWRPESRTRAVPARSDAHTLRGSNVFH